MFFWVVCFFTRKWKKRKKFSNFLFLRFSCEETGFCVFFTRELRCLIFLHTRIALPVFSSHENSVACFFFTREFRCLFFLHTRIPLSVFSSRENSSLCFFFTRESRCPFLHGFSFESPCRFWSISSGATTQSSTTFAPRKHL